MLFLSLFLDTKDPKFCQTFPLFSSQVYYDVDVEFYKNVVTSNLVLPPFNAKLSGEKNSQFQ